MYTGAALLWLLCFNATAQQHIGKKESDQLSRYSTAAKLLVDEDADFKTGKAPAEWDNETAIILAQKSTFGFDKKDPARGKRIGRNSWNTPLTPGVSGSGGNDAETKVVVEERQRHKILLKDKQAVDRFSTLYFRLAAEGDAFAARIVKPDGATQRITLSDAERVDNVSLVPALFKSVTDERISATYQPDYYKIAVLDLAEGDILEYELVNYNTQLYNANAGYKEFEPVYYLCNRELPVVKQVLQVVTADDKYSLCSKSFKGAPVFAQTGDKNVYRWEDNNRAAQSGLHFVNRFIEEPSVKFQVAYARSSNAGFVWLKDAADPQKNLTTDELAEKVKNYWFQSIQSGDYAAGLKDGVQNTAKDIYKYLKQKGITEMQADEYIRKAYYCIRAKTLYNNWSDYAFARVLSALLDLRKIPHEIVATPSNQLSEAETIAFSQELKWLVRCNDKYYANPNKHGNPEDLPAEVNGNLAFRFAYNDAKTVAVTDNLPMSDTLNSSLYATVRVKLQPQENGGAKATVDKAVELKGPVKDAVMDDMLALTPFMESDFRNYDGVGMWDDLDPAARIKAMQDYNLEKKDWKDEKTRMMKELADHFYSVPVSDYTAFRLTQDGRSYRKNSLKYEETLVLDSMLTNTGNDFLVPLPLLTGRDAELKKEEDKRTIQADVKYPQTLDYTIVCFIPIGHLPAGLEEMEKSIHNQAGSFEVDAHIENNDLFVHVRRVFTRNAYSPRQWPQVKELVNAAYNFSQSKILFKTY
ncbi:hypothetical protein DXN05_11165 [Deminuibacter soli]|uniref:DUF3857 domain-containing protein n=2 Tax=Deminuibacter soli TaxID=2291815 RepID=A0A3E1NJH1_9BACT|nr:hypothetical protein DXN05_11165 [Deminuibacter soli]